MKKNFCCNKMANAIGTLDKSFDDPDILIFYTDVFDEYGIIIHDGGSSYLIINFCPWCGKKLPDSKRDRWFEELEKLGYDDPFDMKIPKEYTSDKWYTKDKSQR